MQQYVLSSLEETGFDALATHLQLGHLGAQTLQLRVSPEIDGM
jgi:hypothetical protein